MARFMQETLEPKLEYRWLKWVTFSGVDIAVDCDRDDGEFVPMMVYYLNKSCEWVAVDPADLRNANYNKIFEGIQYYD